MIPLQISLHALKNPLKAKVLSGFFKTGKGQYGEGDIFLGIQVPDTRKIVKEHLSELTLDSVTILLESPYHEERLAGVLCLVEWTKEAGKNHYFVCHSAVEGNETEESLFPILTPHSHKMSLKGMSTAGKKGKYSIQQLAEFYMSHRKHINNWDLVDTSAPQIIGPYIESCLTHEERVKFIDDCIVSGHLWSNRIIVLASFYNINKLKDEALTFYIVSKILSMISANLATSNSELATLNHDLMHKACGWMLREVGKRVSEARLCEFLDEYTIRMPRTMLRYAIERLDKEKKEKYIKKA